MALFSKIILIGDGAVGKTSLRKRFMGTSLNEKYMMTIGADFSIKELHFNTRDRTYTLQYQIWDLAGQQSFRAVRALYYGGVSGVLVVYDVTNRSTYENVKNWLLELKSHSQKIPPVIIIGNKVDLRNSIRTAIQKSEGEELAERLSPYYWGKEHNVGIPYYETSAMTGDNVEQAFLKLADLIIHKVN